MKLVHDIWTLAWHFEKQVPQLENLLPPHHTCLEEETFYFGVITTTFHMKEMTGAECITTFGSTQLLDQFS